MGYIQESRSCHGSPCQDNALGSERKEDMRIGQGKKHVSPEPHKENKVKRRKNKKTWRNGTSISLIISWISHQSPIIILTASCHLSKFCLTNHSRSTKWGKGSPRLPLSFFFGHCNTPSLQMPVHLSSIFSLTFLVGLCYEAPLYITNEGLKSLLLLREFSKLPSPILNADNTRD